MGKIKDAAIFHDTLDVTVRMWYINKGRLLR